MKLIFIFFTLLLFGLTMSHAQLSTDDQKKHFAAGAVISGATYTIVYIKTKNKKKAFWYSLGTSVVAGFAKELYDSQKFDTELDTGEVFATALGGLTVSTTLSLFVGKNKKSNKNIALVN